MSETTNLAVERLLRLMREQATAQEKFCDRMLGAIHSFNDWSVIMEYKINRYLETKDEQWLLEAKKTCLTLKDTVNSLMVKMKEGEKNG